MIIRSLAFILAVCCVVFYSCKKDNSWTAKKYPAIYDSYGRTLILHGLNTSSSAKYDPERQPWIVESDVEREATEFGFNVVRYLIFWDGIEAVKGVFDETYLDKVETRVNWYTSRGIYVLLDMHQDIYSIVFGGDGAPEWAVLTDGHPINNTGSGPWWLKNIDPAVIAAYKNFWNYSLNPDLQDHYIMAWQKVVERFKNDPYVLGYDLMNEPYSGEITTTLSGQFEKKELAQFYNRLIPAIRSIDNDKYIVFEPKSVGVTFGGSADLPKINDTRTGEPRLIFSPHCYPFNLHENGDYIGKDKMNLSNWEKERKEDIEFQETPILTGEFGVSPASAGFDDYLRDFFEVKDKMLGSWTYWSNDLGNWSPLNPDRTETPIMQHLIRTYPRATAGVLKSFAYDAATDIFTMSFTSGEHSGQPTEIFIPQRHYPSGWEISVTGTDSWSKTFDEAKQLLYLSTPESGKDISVEIKPL